MISILQPLLRRRAERAIARDYPTIRAAVRSAFARPGGGPLRDLVGLELSRTLAERFPERPIRVRRTTREAAEAGAAPYAVVGDSHSSHLVRRGRRDGRWLLPLHRFCTGASARGLINPDAAAGAGAKVRAFLELLAAEPYPVLFKFGQVDIEFIFTFKRLEDDAVAFDEAAFDAFCAETVERYMAFLAEATPAPLKPLARVAGVFPPALSDAAWRQGYVNAHIADLHGPSARDLPSRLARLEIPPLGARTRLHARFNERLYTAARAAGFRAFDTFEVLLDPDGTAARRYLGRAAGANHHLGYAASREPLVAALWDALA